mmetsp:Transcript_30326/g.53576  ORF Transcript_30326/g.53576 Transcript_30326/m.53576 type:complete len:280 (-) Transcript_30326:3-842(-)
MLIKMCPTFRKTPKKTTKPEALSPSSFPAYFYGIDYRDAKKMMILCTKTGRKSYCRIIGMHELERYSTCVSPGGVIYLTGGFRDGYICTDDSYCLSYHAMREFACVALPSMISAKSQHASVYYKDYIYAICSSSCERLSLTEGTWEEIPLQPQLSYDVHAILIETSASLYTFGIGSESKALSAVQMLNLNTLTWSVLLVNYLPEPNSYIGIHFKVDDTRIYICLHGGLYAYHIGTNTFSRVKALSIKNLERSIGHYRDGHLYQEIIYKLPNVVNIGELD